MKINKLYVKRISRRIIHFFSAAKNIFDSSSDVIYITESSWIPYRIGEVLCSKIRSIKIRITKSEAGWRNKIVHLSVLGQVKLIPSIHYSNKVIQTVYHIGERGERQVALLQKNLQKVARVQTSCSLVYEKLHKIGIPEEKLILIPLGVDTERFFPYMEKRRDMTRKKLDLPENKIIIGSFQKDGVGWRDGLQPKLIKGPEVFCDVIEKLCGAGFSIHVLLTAPARGYVKKRLEEIGVPYTHHVLDQGDDLVDYYNVIDFYLITSREEGGPQALLEGWATKTPLISTKVGMVSDISCHGENILLAEVDDINMLYEHAVTFIKQPEIRQHLAEAGYKEIQKYDWKKIAARYENDLYKPLV